MSNCLVIYPQVQTKMSVCFTISTGSSLCVVCEVIYCQYYKEEAVLAREQ